MSKDMELNFKDILLKNSHKIMKESVDNSFNELDNISRSFNLDINAALEEENNTEITSRETDFTVEELKEIRKNITKTNYHFPDVINMGKLVNSHNTPSEIQRRYY